jgi:hypothetical protein
VVTLLTPDGDPVDWGQVDSAGDFSVALSGPGRYLVVTAAEGWTPRAQLVDLGAGEEIGTLVLPERLTITGRVTSAPAGAVVALTRHSGELVRSTRTDPAGRFEMPLPPNGRYVLTAVTPEGTVARAVTVWGAKREIDLTVPTGSAAGGEPETPAAGLVGQQVGGGPSDSGEGVGGEGVGGQADNGQAANGQARR